MFYVTWVFEVYIYKKIVETWFFGFNKNESRLLPCPRSNNKKTNPIVFNQTPIIVIDRGSLSSVYNQSLLRFYSFSHIRYNNPKSSKIVTCKLCVTR